MKSIDELMTPQVRTAAVAGHVNPDGDCVGSCTAVWQYLKKRYPGVAVDLYLEEPEAALRFLRGVETARTEAEPGAAYDLVIVCDVSDEERIAVARDLFRNAGRTACIDHHLSNPCFADVNHVEQEASSCCEVLYGLMDSGAVDEGIAESLYTGIIHDCGVFQYRNTSRRTMEIAGALMEKGIDFARIVDESFNQRTYIQNRILGYALERSALHFGGRCVCSVVTAADMERFGAELRDLSMIVSQLRFTKGVECAVFLYEVEADVFKVSLRSNLYLDVAELAGEFGGGGHMRAAGCTVRGKAEAVLAMVLEALSGRLSV